MIHLTSIHKAIKMFSPGLLEAAGRMVAELVSGEEMDCVIEETGIKTRKKEIEEYGSEDRMKRYYAKLNSIWNVDESFLCL